MRQFLQVKQWNQSPGEHHEDDRRVILISFTFLEDSIKILLKQQFGLIGSEKEHRLFEREGTGDAVLGSLYSRGLMAETLDIISAACHADLKSINLIRNTFAHTGHYLKFDNPSLAFFSNLQTVSILGEKYDLMTADSVLLFQVHLQTPRARILGFIMLFWVFCSVMRAPGEPRALNELFGPALPLPSRSTPQGIPDSVHENYMEEIRANPPRSSPA